MADSRDHQSHQATERLTYERLREAGMEKGAARRSAEQAATETHREVDRRNSDRRR